MINFNIKTDSRSVKQGDIFVALKMVNGDGHTYIPKAIENGATTIICTHDELAQDYPDVKFVVVEDSRTYLTEYLITNFKKYVDEMTIIAFTGTNGKSTSVHFIDTALNKLGIPCASIGTVGFFMNGKKVKYLANTSPDIGEMYDLLLTAYNAGVKTVALEASSHGFGYHRLEGIEYDYAAFTNLTRDHLDFHKTVENYAACKRQLFERLKPTGLACINYDDPKHEYFTLEKNRNLLFGFDGGDVVVTKYDMSQEGTQFDLSINGTVYPFFTQVIGKYNVSNMIPIILFLQDMGIEMSKIQEVIPTLTAPDGRIEAIPYGTNRIYIDYAHTPDGMEKILTNVKAVTKGKTYVVFCCRGKRDIGRRPQMMKLATELCEYAIVTSDNFYGESFTSVLRDMLSECEKDNYEVNWNRREAIQRGIDLLDENDSLLVLGKGHEDYLVLPNKQKIHFYDKEEILNYIKTK